MAFYAGHEPNAISTYIVSTVASSPKGHSCPNNNFHCPTHPPPNLTEHAFSCAGHYIVVVSYNANTDRYGIRDPASEYENVLVPSASLDLARTSFGTDEDVLLISTRPARC